MSSTSYLIITCGFVKQEGLSHQTSTDVIVNGCAMLRLQSYRM